MKSIVDLQNPDIVTINGKEYQVLKHMELFFDRILQQMSMCVELTSVTDPHISPTLRLIYDREKPGDVTLHAYDKTVDRYLPARLDEFII